MRKYAAYRLIIAMLATSPVPAEGEAMTLRRDFEEAAAKRMQRLQRAVIEASEPFVQMKIDALNVSLPKITITGKGMPEIEYAPDVHAKLEEIEVRRLEAVVHVMRMLQRREDAGRE